MKTEVRQELKPPLELKAFSTSDHGITEPVELADIQELEARTTREANPEPTREAKPIQLLKERAANPETWQACVEDCLLYTSDAADD